MAAQSSTSRKELSIDILKRETKITDVQLDTRVEEADLLELAACFDNTEDYVERLGLSPGQQTDVNEVKAKTYINGTQAGMKVALKCWRNKNPMEATFRALLLVLLSLIKGNIAFHICKYLSDKVSSYPPQSESEFLNPELFSYRKYIQSRYKAFASVSSKQIWPPVPTTTVFKLAMIQKEKIQRGKIDDRVTRLSISGQVGDIFILSGKKQIEIKDIFAECCNKRKFVLIEGAPGSGKSTLALHICQEWADEKLFQEFAVIVLVRLRDPLVREAKTIADLLPRASEAMAENAARIMVSTVGSGILWVLDGWDEFVSDLSTDSIINKLIEPTTYQDSPLLNSAVIVTSRPLSSAELHPLVSSRIEILGFTPNELEDYFRECLKGDSGAVQTLLERIRENPVVEGSCYLPLNAAIVAHVFLSGNQSLPTSNHEIFMSVVRLSLSRYMQDRLHMPFQEAVVTSLDKLPQGIQKLFNHLCKLAYFGVAENKVTFVNHDFSSAGVNPKVCDLSLLQVVPSILVNSQEYYYNFLHLSVQELLAAVHISYMPAVDQLSKFKELFGNPRFAAVFQFYAGITRLKTCRPILSKLPRFVLPNTPRKMHDLISSIVRNKEQSQLICLLHCLYEAEHPPLFNFVVGLLDNVLNLANAALNPLDCLTVGFFLSAINFSANSTCTTAYLHSCSISDQGCKLLVRGLSKHRHSPSSTISEIELDLMNNNIREEGAQQIAALLKTNTLVHKLKLSYNKIGEGGFQSLCEALSFNTTLKKLDLRMCYLTICEKTGLLLYHLLSTNNCLSHLNLSGNNITDCRHIAAGLSRNQSLKILDLTSCMLNEKCIEELFTSQLGSCIHIKELNIRGNDSITNSGLKTMVNNLDTFIGLKCLLLPHCLTSSIETVFSEVNQTRKCKNLPEIEVP